MFTQQQPFQAGSSQNDGVSPDVRGGDDDELESFPQRDIRMSKDNTKLVTLTRKEVLELLAETRDLQEKDIRKANLIKIDFSGCDLRGVNFSYSNLKDCSFRDADLRGASLWNANLEGADFTNANLEDADLDYAKLRGAILFRANIRRASLPTELIPREDIEASVNTGCRVGGK